MNMSKYWNKKINDAEPYVAGEQPKEGQKIIKLYIYQGPDGKVYQDANGKVYASKRKGA